jgi:hypothetical protein
MTSYTASYPQMIVHRTGCKDIVKVANRSADTTVIREAADLNSFLDRELADDLGEMGYTRDDFDCKPCTRGN